MPSDRGIDMKKFIKRVSAVALGLVASTLIWGCSTLSLVPTVVPPLMDTLIEGETPHVVWFGQKVTLQGIVDARMKYHDTLYPAVRQFYDIGRSMSQNIATTVLGVLTAAGMAGTGALPLALKAVPKGYVKKEEE